MIKEVLSYSRQVGLLGLILLATYLFNPFFKGFLIGYLLIMLIVLKPSFIKSNLDFDFLLLLFFSIIYGICYSFDPVAGIQYIVVYMFTAPFLYLWGKFLVVPDMTNLKLISVLVGIGIILSFPALISVLLNILEGGFAQKSRNIPMFWGADPVNATGMAAPLIINMCIPAILLSGYKRLKMPTKLFLGIVFTLTLLCAIRLGSRTQLAVTLITIAIVFVYQFSSRTAKQNAILILGLIFTAFLIYRNVSFDWDADWLTSFAGRMNNNGTNDLASGGGRTDRWVRSLENLIKKPMGWSVDEFGFSHNLWLDVARVGGLAALGVFSLLTVRAWKQISRFLRVFNKDLMLSATVMTIFVALFLLCFVDVVIDGSFHIYVALFICYGCINKYRQVTVERMKNSKRSIS